MYVCGDRYVERGREREREWGGGGGADECWWMDGCILYRGRELEKVDRQAIKNLLVLRGMDGWMDEFDVLHFFEGKGQ